MARCERVRLGGNRQRPSPRRPCRPSGCAAEASDGAARRRGSPRPGSPRPEGSASPARPAPGDRTRVDPVLQAPAGPTSPNAPPEEIQFDGATANDNLPFFKTVFSSAGCQRRGRTATTTFRRSTSSSGSSTRTETRCSGRCRTASLWSGLGGFCETANAGTPLVKFDTMAARWIVSQVGLRSVRRRVARLRRVLDERRTRPGTYNQYDFRRWTGSIAHERSGSASGPTAITSTVNQFNGFANAGFGIYALDRERDARRRRRRRSVREPGHDAPRDALGVAGGSRRLAPPPDGSPNVSIALGQRIHRRTAAADLVHVWRFHADFADPENSTFEGPFDVPIDDVLRARLREPDGGGCVPQLDSEQLLQANAEPADVPAPYRNFGDHESLVTNVHRRRHPARTGLPCAGSSCATPTEIRSLPAGHVRARRELSLHRLDRDGP